MKVQMKDITTLKPDPNNARQHDERNLKAIQESLGRFGQQKPIVINRENVILAGNGTCAAARSLGWTEIAVIVTDLEEHAATAFAIADNRTAELAEWDQQVLADSLKTLQDQNDTWLESCGFEKAELDAILESMDEWSKPEPPPIPLIYHALVECEDEKHQQAVYEWLNKGGYTCKLSSF